MRQTNLLKVVGLQNLAGSLLDPVPEGGFGRKYIASAFDSLKATTVYGTTPMSVFIASPRLVAMRASDALLRHQWAWWYR
jgi:hypothetical protein